MSVCFMIKFIYAVMSHMTVAWRDVTLVLPGTTGKRSPALCIVLYGFKVFDRLYEERKALILTEEEVEEDSVEDGSRILEDSQDMRFNDEFGGLDEEEKSLNSDLKNLF
ncbi:hypothetical protein AAMO2058_000566100 [Amorphochlora amoebiformis]